MRGGARPGAGRPKTGKALREVPVALPEKDLRFIDKLAERDKASRSAVVRNLVAWAIKNRMKREEA